MTWLGLATAAGITPAGLRKIRKGDVIPKQETLVSLEKALQLPPGSLHVERPTLFWEPPTEQTVLIAIKVDRAVSHAQLVNIRTTLQTVANALTKEID